MSAAPFRPASSIWETTFFSVASLLNMTGDDWAMAARKVGSKIRMGIPHFRFSFDVFSFSILEMTLLVQPVLTSPRKVRYHLKVGDERGSGEFTQVIETDRLAAGSFYDIISRIRNKSVIYYGIRQ